MQRTRERANAINFMTTLCVCYVKPNKPLQFYDSKAIKIMSIFSHCNDNRFFVLSPAQMPFVIFMVRTFSVGFSMIYVEKASILSAATLIKPMKNRC